MISGSNASNSYVQDLEIRTEAAQTSYLHLWGSEVVTVENFNNGWTYGTKMAGHGPRQSPRPQNMKTALRHHHLGKTIQYKGAFLLSHPKYCNRVGPL